MQRAVVIGGGVAGLATSALLGHAGLEVTLVEKNSELGGRAGVLHDRGFRFDTGPSWYLMPDAFERFFQLLGTTSAQQLDLVRLSPAYRVFPENATPFDVHSGVENVMGLFEKLEPGSGTRAHNYLSTAAFTYDMAVKHFLYTAFSSPRPFLNRDVLTHLPLLAQLLTRSLRTRVEGRFTDRRIQQVLEYPAVFLSTTPRRAPAMYHLLSATDLVDAVRYPLGGFGTLIDALTSLAQANGVQIVTDAEVQEITTQPGRRKAQATGVRLADKHIPADIVVSAADMFHTERDLLPKKLWSVRSWKHKDPGISCVVAMLGVEGELPELAHHQLLLSDEWDQDFERIAAKGGASRSIYVCKTSATDESAAPKGYSNLFVLIPVHADEKFGASGSQAVESIVDDSMRLIEQRTGVRLSVVVRHTLGPTDFATSFHAWRGNAIGLAHTLRQSAFLRGRNASRKVAGLYFAGATTVPGVGLPMCLISAENVLIRLREEGKL